MKGKLKKTPDRQLYLDFLRTISMFAVVFLHCSSRRFSASDIARLVAFTDHAGILKGLSTVEHILNSEMFLFWY